MIDNNYQSEIEKITSLVKENKLVEAKDQSLLLLNQISVQNNLEITSLLNMKLGQICFNLAELDTSVNYYDLAIDCFSKVGNIEGIAYSYSGIGNVFLVKSEYAKAITFFEDASDFYLKIDGKEGIAKNKSNLGLVYIELSEYPKAIECFEKALVLNEQIGNKNGIATNFGNFGNVYYYLADYERAIEYYEKAIQLYEEIGGINEKIVLLGNIGGVYLATKEFAKSKVFYEKALQLSKKESFTTTIASIYGNLGVVHKELQQFDKAIDYYKQSLLLNTELDKKISLAINYCNLAEIYFFNKEYEIAQDYLEKSINIGIEFKNNYVLQECFKLQSEIYESIRKYKKSNEYLRKYIAIKDEIQIEKSLQRAVIFDEKRKIELENKQREVKFARLEEQEKLLHNILPMNIADRILQNENFIADFYDSVSVLFMDLVGFTPLSSIAPPKQLVYILDSIFTKADEIIELFGLEKIKTIGDGYLAVANVTKPIKEHQKATALAALELQKAMKEFEVVISKDLGDINWIQKNKIIEIRIGIHTGEVVAGVIGKHKHTYDLWGDAVNIASRMESHSESGRIHISSEFAKFIEHYQEFSVIPRGEISIKGKGTMNTFWLENGK